MPKALRQNRHCLVLSLKHTAFDHVLVQCCTHNRNNKCSCFLLFALILGVCKKIVFAIQAPERVYQELELLCPISPFLPHEGKVKSQVSTNPSRLSLLSDQDSRLSLQTEISVMQKMAYGPPNAIYPTPVTKRIEVTQVSAGVKKLNSTFHRRL